MAPINKAQAAGVSSGSFLELRIQVEKQKEIYAKDKATGNATAIVGRKKNGKVRLISVTCCAPSVTISLRIEAK